MNGNWTVDLAWWITVVELPALGGLFWLIWRARRDAEELFEHTRDAWTARMTALGDNLAAYKLEVAKSYASIAYLKDVERRLTGHLVRIENKLDRVSTPARTALTGGEL